MPLHYQERQWPAGAPAQHIRTGNLEQYAWALTNRPALDEEDNAPPLADTTPDEALAPGAFEVQGHAGSATTWQSFGQWSYELNAGRTVLPPATIARVAELIKNAPDPRTQVARLYNLLQGSARYISVQLDLGGWQTFPTNAVATDDYGDCKALSNYTVALLTTAGVPAYVALIGAGADHADLRPDFSSNQFNHAIVCVPLATAGHPDTLWLECTSQTTALGYMSNFTGNRHALLLTPGDGQVVATPRYRCTDNRRERRIDLYLNAAGAATATARTLRTGQEQDTYAQVLHELGPTEQKQYVAERLRLSTFTISKFGLAAAPGADTPGVIETLGLALPGYAPPSGKRVFVSPNLIEPITRPTRADRYAPNRAIGAPRQPPGRYGPAALPCWLPARNPARPRAASHGLRHLLGPVPGPARWHRALRAPPRAASPAPIRRVLCWLRRLPP